MWRPILSLTVAIVGIGVVSHMVQIADAQGQNGKSAQVTALPQKSSSAAIVPATGATASGAPHGAVSSSTTAAGPVPLTPDEQALRLFKPVGEIAAQWLRRPELQQSMVGLEIMDIPSGRVLFSHNGRKRFVSASTAKVFTNACAYDLLGGNYRYRTTMVGYGDIHNGRLEGSVVVIPSQDPSFSTNSLNGMISTLSTKVKSIAGNIHVGQIPGGGDYFATEYLVQDWGQDWMPASSDFVLDRNVALLKDLGRGYPVVNASSDQESTALLRTLLKGPWASTWVQFNRSNNTVIFHRPDGALQNAPVVANPTDYNAAVVKSVLKNHGIKVGGKEIPMVGNASVLAQDSSPPLSEIIAFCLEESDNLYAQQLLRTIGSLPPLNNKLEHASLEDRGLARMSYWLATSCGVPPGEAILFDGSGLSRKDAVTPHALNMVLRHMGGASGTGPFLDLLRRDSEGSSRTFRYKTGAMDSVRSISGVVRTSTGQPLAMTVIVNNHTPSVRELRASLMSLVSRMESLGALKLTPVAQPGKAKVKNKAKAVASKAKPKRTKPQSRKRRR